MFGPSGSGKTTSALKLAHGMADWPKIAIIDTENGSADLYSHLGPYMVLPLQAPYSPERYIEAIKTCEDAGAEVIIVDSITHEWSGIGGILELADQLSVAAKNSFTVWNKLTPRHNAFIKAILESPRQIICCGRTKQEYVMNEVEKNGKKVIVPEKIGLKAITREGFDFEMTISFDIAINHYASTTKDRTGLFMGRPEFVINEDTGKTLAEWNQTAKPDPINEKREIMAQLRRIGLQTKDAELIRADISQYTGLELTEANFEAIIEKLKTMQPIPPATPEPPKDQNPPQGTAPATNPTPEPKEPIAPQNGSQAVAPAATPAPAPAAAEPAETPEQIKARKKAERDAAPKASKAMLGLFKTLLHQKQGVPMEDTNSQLGYVTLACDVEVDTLEEITQDEIKRINQGLTSQKTRESENEKTN